MPNRFNGIPCKNPFPIGAMLVNRIDLDYDVRASRLGSARMEMGRRYINKAIYFPIFYEDGIEAIRS